MKINIRVNNIALENYLSQMQGEYIECFCGIDGQKAENHGPVYRFATEDITSYIGIFDVTKLLTVNGSSDQLINALLYGARRVDTFDINYDTLHILLIKLYAILNLNQEDFIRLLNKSDSKIFEDRVLPNVSHIYQLLWEELFKKYGKTAFKELLNGPLLIQTPKNKICKINPYLNGSNYENLKGILESGAFEINFLGSDFLELGPLLGKQEYSAIFLSNIYTHLFADTLESSAVLKMYCEAVNSMFNNNLTADGQILLSYSYGNWLKMRLYSLLSQQGIQFDTVVMETPIINSANEIAIARKRTMKG